jgi:hypothetical protein
MLANNNALWITAIKRFIIQALYNCRKKVNAKEVFDAISEIKLKGTNAAMWAIKAINSNLGFGQKKILIIV